METDSLLAALPKNKRSVLLPAQLLERLARGRRGAPRLRGVAVLLRLAPELREELLLLLALVHQHLPERVLDTT